LRHRPDIPNLVHIFPEQQRPHRDLTRMTQGVEGSVYAIDEFTNFEASVRLSAAKAPPAT